MDVLTEIEQACEKQLEKAGLADLWPSYEVARHKVFKDLLPFIRQSEPFLSDHGPDHILNVLNNAWALLGREQCTGKDSKRALEATELYFLVLSALFHDVGNVFNRVGHKSRLSEAYEFARGTDQALLPERQLLFKIIEAHGGVTEQGSSDTIGPLDRSGVFRSKRVDCQRVAAILRLSDELAEGPQRTSLFMQKHFPYASDARVFHDYANICNVHIGRQDSRLAVVFHVDIMPESWGEGFDAARLRELLEFCFRRIVKLDLERKYNSHYCSLLRQFRQTEVSFHFHRQNRDLRLDLPKIVLNDLVLPSPGDTAELMRANPGYELEQLMEILSAVATPVSELKES